MNASPQPDPAQTRWMILNLVRVGGLVLSVVGAIVWKKGMGEFQDATVGKLVLVAGLFLSLVVPALLRRAWRSKDTATDDPRR
jgi:hypothetical protein